MPTSGTIPLEVLAGEEAPSAWENDRPSSITSPKSASSGIGESARLANSVGGMELSRRLGYRYEESRWLLRLRLFDAATSKQRTVVTLIGRVAAVDLT